MLLQIINHYSNLLYGLKIIDVKREEALEIKSQLTNKSTNTH
jgi:hypothetical protein